MFSFLSPYKWAIEALAFMTLVAGITYGVHTFLNHERQIGYDKAVAEYTARELVAEQVSRATEQRLTKQIEDAQNEAVIRNEQIQELARAVADSSGSLHDTVAALRGGLPTASVDALRHTADAALAVFSDCQAKYGRLAEVADRHASDVETLTEAWPKLGQTPVIK